MISIAFTWHSIGPSEIQLIAAEELRSIASEQGHATSTKDAEPNCQTENETSQNYGTKHGASGTVSPKTGFEPIRFSGTVIGVSGLPATNADVHVHSHVGYVPIDAKFATDGKGRFECAVEVKREWLPGVSLQASSADGRELGYYRFPEDGGSSTRKPILIKLEPGKQARIKVVDANGQPVAEARVAIQLGYPHVLLNSAMERPGVYSFRLPKSERIEAVVAWKEHHGLDYRQYSLSRERQADVNAKAPEFPTIGEETLRLAGVAPLIVHVTDDRNQPLDGIRLSPWLLRKSSEPGNLNLSFFSSVFSATTDSTGKATFNWIPAWHDSLIQVWPIATEFAHARGIYDVHKGSGKLDMQLERLVPIRGRIVAADGTPKSGIGVEARGAGYSLDSGSASATSDANGQYELLVPPGQIYLVVVRDPQWASAPQDGFAVFRNQPAENKDFRLRKATRVFGKLLNAETQEPIANGRVTVYLYGQELQSLSGIELPNPENSTRTVRPMQFYHATTDQQGQFEFALGDGDFDIRPPGKEKAINFEISGQAKTELLLTTQVEQDVVLVGLVVAKEGQSPLEGARVTGVARHFLGKNWQATTGSGGKFRVNRHREAAYVYAASSDGKLAAIDDVGADKKTFVFQLLPVGVATGRLLAADAHRPIGSERIDYGVRVPDENDASFTYRFGGSVITDANGGFRLDGLVAGVEYILNLERRGDGMLPRLTTLKVAPGQTVDLGNVPAPRRLK